MLPLRPTPDQNLNLLVQFRQSGHQGFRGLPPPSSVVVFFPRRMTPLHFHLHHGQNRSQTGTSVTAADAAERVPSGTRLFGRGALPVQACRLACSSMRWEPVPWWTTHGGPGERRRLRLVYKSKQFLKARSGRHSGRRSTRPRTGGNYHQKWCVHVASTECLRFSASVFFSLRAL